MEKKTMAVMTRSTLAGRKSQEKDSEIQAADPEGSAYKTGGREREKIFGTEIKEVKIKQELIEEALCKKSTEGKTAQTRAKEDGHEEKSDVGEPMIHYRRGKTVGLGRRFHEKNTEIANTITGKRRYLGTKSGTRNKKYFQDIRAYAQISQLYNRNSETNENSIVAQNKQIDNTPDKEPKVTKNANVETNSDDKNMDKELAKGFPIEVNKTGERSSSDKTVIDVDMEEETVLNPLYDSDETGTSIDANEKGSQLLLDKTVIEINMETENVCCNDRDLRMYVDSPVLKKTREDKFVAERSPMTIQ